MEEKTKPEFDPVAADTALELIRSLDFESASIDEIKELLRPILRGYAVNIPGITPGNNFYQAVLGDKPTNISAVKYPSEKMADYGLVHRVGERYFYSYAHRDAAIIEVGAKAGDTLAVAHWISTDVIQLNHAGYTQSVFDALQSQRPLPSIDPDTPFVTSEAYVGTTDFVSAAFVDIVGDGSRPHNKLTVALAECLLNGKVPLQGLLYPSTIYHAHLDISILTADAADKYLRLKKVEFIRIDSIVEGKYSITILDTAPEISTKGIIEWYAGSSIGLSRRYGTVGWEEFLRQKKSMLEEYDKAKDMNANKPVKTEHGNIGEAVFREWLASYLPKKYGVTHGYVVPDARAMNYVLRHYDLIVYDALNAPVLWTSANPDKSDQGRERAIPIKYVQAVFEVKATLTKASIKDAVKKLEEVKEFEDQLDNNFISCAIFFEVREAEQKSCALAETLFEDGVPGYFGGLVLRAEGLDPNVTGYYEFWSAEQTEETNSEMPLVREFSSAGRNDQGGVEIPPGEQVNSVNYDMVWNFDRAYTPPVKMVELMWSYNSFPSFLSDLIQRLDGTYNHTLEANEQKLKYGFSFIR